MEGKRRRKAERKAYEEKFARLEAKRKGIAYVSLADSSDEESDWSVEEQAEAKGELDFLQQKAKEALVEVQVCYGQNFFENEGNGKTV